MPQLFLKLPACLLLAMTLAGCSEPAVPASQTPAELAAAVTAAELDATSSMGPEEHATLKAMIEGGGGTCERITRVQGSELSSTLEVDCGEGATGYTIDLESVTAVPRN